MWQKATLDPTGMFKSKARTSSVLWMPTTGKITRRSTNMTGLGSYLDGVNSCMLPVIDPMPLLQCKVIYSADKALKHACESGRQWQAGNGRGSS